MVEIITGILLLFLVYIVLASDISAPNVEAIDVPKRVQIAPNHYTIGNNWLKKNEFGIWEMYIEGTPYERGLVYGELAKELVQYQEAVFVDQIKQFVPSERWRSILQLMISYFNRKIPDHLPLENQQEIYGISKSFSDEFDHIAPKYDRILNYHAAHDIGHALNDYSMIGCTSFALKDEKTEDGKLLVGRNFDFYVGDDFAKEKIVLIVNPSKGIPFITYSWAGFTGVASGLNAEGLSVTINASKSDLPTGSKMPISLLAREILQYASTLDEAIRIAQKRETFVSETLMIASSKDHKAVLIEKSPSKMGVFAPNEDVLICANHYQSETFKNDPVNVKNISDSDSRYRFQRMQTLLQKHQEINPIIAASILRDQQAVDGDTLGMGNPRAINQLLAHHSVVIQPEQQLFYVSTKDFQLGKYIGYPLKTILELKAIPSELSQIAEDPFLNSKAYEQFLFFRNIKKTISNYLTFGTPLSLDEVTIDRFITSNQESYITYEMLGRYFLKKKQKVRAQHFFERALTKNVASKTVENELKDRIKECKQQ